MEGKHVPSGFPLGRNTSVDSVPEGHLMLPSTGSWPNDADTGADVMGAASMLIRSHGDEAKIRADRRISELAAIGDDQGIAMWNKIACCINVLSGTGTSN